MRVFSHSYPAEPILSESNQSMSLYDVQVSLQLWLGFVFNWLLNVIKVTVLYALMVLQLLCSVASFFSYFALII